MLPYDIILQAIPWVSPQNLSLRPLASLGADICAQADLEAHLFLLARELLVPLHGFSSVLACSVSFSWTYDTEKVKHVLGLMGMPIFCHLLN
jgi:hypothetical protein